MTCSNLALTITPGTCVPFSNQCAGTTGVTGWTRGDSLRLCGGPPGITFRTNRDPRSREICAAANVGVLTNARVDYSYARPHEFGTGIINVSTIAPLQVSAMAMPASIGAGGSSALSATASGGTSPYSYSWFPTTSLNDPAIASPTATPSQTTVYTVTVTDANGAVSSAQVVVTVNAQITVTASPNTIDAGASSQLSVVVNGGTPPFTYAWSPAGSLNDVGISDPIASPVTTTTYQVTVTDSSGATQSGSVTVLVNLRATLSASPTTVSAGSTSQLDAQVTGGNPPYQYSWSPAGSLSDPNIANPVAAPGATTTYQLIVGDADGRTVTEFITVNVVAGGLTACFVTNPAMPSPGPVQFDATCSSGGTIVEYRWWFDWPAPGPFQITPAPVVNFGFEFPATFNVRLEVVDALGNTDDIIVPIVVQ